MCVCHSLVVLSVCLFGFEGQLNLAEIQCTMIICSCNHSFGKPLLVVASLIKSVKLYLALGNVLITVLHSYGGHPWCGCYTGPSLYRSCVYFAGKKWKSMAAEKQQRYRDEYLTHREEYKEKMKSFLEEHPEAKPCRLR